MLALVFLGLLAQIPYMAWIERWAERYWSILREPLGFKKMRPPVDTTISRALAGCSLEELQNAFADFLRTALAETDEPVTIAVDEKTSGQFFDTDDHPILMLNVFVHDLKVTFDQWSVRGDKTKLTTCVVQQAVKPGDYPACLFTDRPLKFQSIYLLLKKTKIPFLFPTITSESPSLFTSAAMA